MNLKEEFEMDFIVSQDGTTIGFRKMSGSDSQPYFKPVLDALMETIPKVTRIEFKNN